MQQTPAPGRYAAAAKLISAMTVSVGGLYLGTHSVLVTLIGTAAGSVLACWTLRSNDGGPGREESTPARGTPVSSVALPSEEGKRENR
jgi:hypothetical protein